MKKVVFYQIQDGDTGAQVVQGLQGNFEALQQEIEAIPPYSLPIKMDPNSGIINSEEDYNSILPESYLTEYPWQAEYAGGLPWLWMNFKAKVSEGTQICIKHNNKFCEFTNIPETIGTVSVNKKILTMKEKNEYLGFECQKDLGVQKVDLKGIYQVYVLGADGSVEQEIVFECK